MPTISFQIDIEGLSAGDALAFAGPMLNVGIGQDIGFQSGPGVPPQLPDMLFPALIDTGCRVSCIDANLAHEMDLPIVGDTPHPIAGILGPGEVDVFLAEITVPELHLTVAGRFPGVHLAAGGQPYGAILGRDILRTFTMMYDGRAGVVTLSDE